MPGMDNPPVEAFLDSFPEPIRRGAGALRAIVRRVAPDAEERVRGGWGMIGYNVPAGRRSPYIGGVFPQHEHVHLLFEHGVLMADPLGILEGAGTTKRVRWLTFRGPDEIAGREDELARYVEEAIRVATLSRGERELLALSRDG